MRCKVQLGTDVIAHQPGDQDVVGSLRLRDTRMVSVMERIQHTHDLRTVFVSPIEVWCCCSGMRDMLKVTQVLLQWYA
jgi:hypothetical protein